MKLALPKPRRHMWVEIWLHVFLTSAVVGGWWSTSRSGRSVPGDQKPAPTEKEAGWAPQTVWAFWGKKYFLALPGFVSRSSNLQTSCYTDYANTTWIVAGGGGGDKNLLLWINVSQCFLCYVIHLPTATKRQWTPHHSTPQCTPYQTHTTQHHNAHHTKHTPLNTINVH